MSGLTRRRATARRGLSADHRPGRTPSHLTMTFASRRVVNQAMTAAAACRRAETSGSAVHGRPTRFGLGAPEDITGKCSLQPVWAAFERSLARRNCGLTASMAAISQ